MCIFKMSIYNCIPSEYFFQKAKIFFRDTQVKNNHHKKILEALNGTSRIFYLERTSLSDSSSVSGSAIGAGGGNFFFIFLQYKRVAKSAMRFTTIHLI